MSFLNILIFLLFFSLGFFCCFALGCLVRKIIIIRFENIKKTSEVIEKELELNLHD